MLCCRSETRKSGVVAVSWAAWIWFLVWVRSLLRAAMGCAQARLVRTRASGVARAERGDGVGICIASSKRLAASGITVRFSPASSRAGREDPAYPSPEPCAGLGSGLMGGVLDLTGRGANLRTGSKLQDGTASPGTCHHFPLYLSLGFPSETEHARMLVGVVVASLLVGTPSPRANRINDAVWALVLPVGCSY